MDVRFTTDKNSYKRMTTDELKKLYLIDTLFHPNTVTMVYSDIDRSITGSAVPLVAPLQLLSSKKEMAAEYFTERRELGIINIGAAGTVVADGIRYELQNKDGLYVGRGTKTIEFSSSSPDAPAKFYFVSYPAHTAYPTTKVSLRDADEVHIGNKKDANDRIIHKYFQPGKVSTCQIAMGLTELQEGSVWNTMPVHTHQRRSEVYMYFDMDEDQVLFHFFGDPTETRHFVMRNGQAVLSPSWSIHSGVATRNYTFIWAMGGENQSYDDMDWVAMQDLN